MTKKNHPTLSVEEMLVEMRMAHSHQPNQKVAGSAITTASCVGKDVMTRLPICRKICELLQPRGRGPADSNGRLKRIHALGPETSLLEIAQRMCSKTNV